VTSGIDIRHVTFAVGEHGTTSGMLTVPSGTMKSLGIVLAHGAGNDMTHALMAAFSNGLAAAGYPVLRFNFLYAEHKRKAPDKEPLLVAAWTAADRFFREGAGLTATRVAAAGKSMGGRIASQMIADGQLRAERLIFLGYPLHRSGDPSRLRDTHLYRLDVPMLFIEGTRDPLCDRHALDGVLSRLKAPHDLFVVDRGDHSFHVPKSAGLSDTDVYARIVEKSSAWLSA
jgi:predicted alpha/beta-hydrolase family hydrolase